MTNKMVYVTLGADGRIAVAESPQTAERHVSDMMLTEAQKLVYQAREQGYVSSNLRLRVAYTIVDA